MKINIQVDSTIEEDEVLIKCREVDGSIKIIYNFLMNHNSTLKSLALKKDNSDYYIPLDEIIFFESNNNYINAHTVDDIFTTEYKLYELENILPKFFLRISKSTIINISHIYSVSRNISSSSLVAFRKTHKQVYVSRRYYKTLKTKIDEMRSIL